MTETQRTMSGRLHLPGQWTDQTEVADEDAMLVACNQSSHTRVVMRALGDGQYERVIKPPNDENHTNEYVAEEDIEALWKTIDWLREREHNGVETTGGP